MHTEDRALLTVHGARSAAGSSFAAKPLTLTLSVTLLLLLLVLALTLTLLVLSVRLHVRGTRSRGQFAVELSSAVTLPTDGEKSGAQQWPRLYSARSTGRTCLAIFMSPSILDSLRECIGSSEKVM